MGPTPSSRTPATISSPTGSQEADGQDRQEDRQGGCQWLRHSAAQRDPTRSMDSAVGATRPAGVAAAAHVLGAATNAAEESDTRSLARYNIQIAEVSDMFGVEGRLRLGQRWESCRNTPGKVWNWNW